MGLINAISALDLLEAEGVKWAREILQNSPTAIKCLKFSFNACLVSSGPISDLPGFCIGGSCDLGFSPLEGDNIQEGNYEYLESEESTKSCNIDNNVTNKGEKAKQMDDDYSRLMAERGNDMMPGSR